MVEKIKKFFKKLNSSEGIVVVPVVIITTFIMSFLFLTQVGTTVVQPYVDAKNNNPDAVLTLNLEPVDPSEYYGDDMIIQRGRFNFDRSKQVFDENLQKWIFAPNGLADKERYIWYDEYEKWVHAPDGLDSPTRYMCNVRSETEDYVVLEDGEYVYAAKVDAWLRGEDISIKTAYRDETENIDIKYENEDIPSADGVYAVDKLKADNPDIEADLGGQEKILNNSSKVFGDFLKNESMKALIEKNNLDGQNTSDVPDLDKDISDTLENVIVENSVSDISVPDVKSILNKTMDGIYTSSKNTAMDLFDRSKTILETIKQELINNKKLAEEQLISKRKELAREKLSLEYNEKIIKEYESLEAKGYTVTDPTEWAEAKRRYENALSKINEVEKEIKEMEAAMQASAQTTKDETASTDNGTTTSTTKTTSTTTTTTSSTTTTTVAGSSEIVKLKGGLEGVANSLTLEINLKTGIVKGTVKYIFTQNLEGASIRSSYTGNLTGSIDPNTLKINGTGNGDLIITNIGTGESIPESWNSTFTGNLKDDHSSANGSMDVTYSWFGQSGGSTLSWNASK